MFWCPLSRNQLTENIVLPFFQASPLFVDFGGAELLATSSVKKTGDLLPRIFLFEQVGGKFHLMLLIQLYEKHDFSCTPACHKQQTQIYNFLITSETFQIPNTQVSCSICLDILIEMVSGCTFIHQHERQ